MEYILLWNPGTKNAFIHTDEHGYPADFGSYQDAYEEGLRNVQCNDNPDPHFGLFQVFQAVTSDPDSLEGIANRLIIIRD